MEVATSYSILNNSVTGKFPHSKCQGMPTDMTSISSIAWNTWNMWNIQLVEAENIGSMRIKKYFAIFQVLLKENSFSNLWLTTKENLLTQKVWPMRWRHCMNSDLQSYNYLCIKIKFCLAIRGTCERSSGDFVWPFCYHQALKA